MYRHCDSHNVSPSRGSWSAALVSMAFASLLTLPSMALGPDAAVTRPSETMPNARDPFAQMGDKQVLEFARRYAEQLHAASKTNAIQSAELGRKLDPLILKASAHNSRLPYTIADTVLAYENRIAQYKWIARSPGLPPQVAEMVGYKAGREAGMSEEAYKARLLGFVQQKQQEAKQALESALRETSLDPAAVEVMKQSGSCSARAYVLGTLLRHHIDEELDASQPDPQKIRRVLWLLRADQYMVEVGNRSLGSETKGAFPATLPTVQTAQASFRAPIERVIQIGVKSPGAYLDLETGNVLEPPPIPRDEEKWAVRQGADLCFRPSHSALDASTVHMLVLDVPNERWESATAAEVLADPSLEDGGFPCHPIRERLDQLPVTFFFRTLDGTKGVLQIVADPIAPGTITVRYRLAVDDSPANP